MSRSRGSRNQRGGQRRIIWRGRLPRELPGLPRGPSGGLTDEEIAELPFAAPDLGTAGARVPIVHTGRPGAGVSSATRERLGRATANMAAGTLASRVTGLLRIMVAAYALGYGGLSDAFNLANNTPNIIHDLVLGGILAATFVPMFVHRLATRPRREALDSISAVITLAALVLVGATVLFFALAPQVIGLYTIGSHAPDIALERSVATELLRWFSPQLLAYGAISLMTALLSTARRFTLPAFVPILNNVIAIGVLLEFAAVGHVHTLQGIRAHQGLIVLLGLGTTLGVVVQALALIPATRACGIPVRFHWNPRDAAVREVTKLSTWTFGFVMANQIAVFVISALAVHIGQATFTAYTYAFTFFQLPFGMIAVSVMSAVTPALADRFSAEDAAGFAHQFGLGLRRLIAGVVPAAVGYLILAQPLMALLLGHGAGDAYSGAGPRLTATLLVLLSLGLPGYCIYLYAIRAFQARRDTRTPFYLYLGENALNILLAFAFTPSLGAKGLALSLSVAYTVAAAAALWVLRSRTGGLGGRAVARYALRTMALSVVMAFCVAVTAAAVGSDRGTGLVVRVVVAVAAGLLAYVAGAGLAGTIAGWQTSQPRRRGARRGTNAKDSSRHR